MVDDVVALHGVGVAVSTVLKLEVAIFELVSELESDVCLERPE